MKKIQTKFKNIFSLFFIFICYALVAQDKKVVWVHGLGDATEGSNKSCWSERYANEFASERKLNSMVTNFTSTTTSGVGNYADFVARQSSHAQDGIGIGHSMGGMALRHIDVFHPQSRNFKGIITFASPLTGANIINDVPATNRFFDNFLFNTSRGIEAQLGFSTSISRLFSVGIGTIGGTVASFIKAPPWGNTRGDLAEGSGYVNTFNNTSTPTPKINIWGNEDNPVAWRMLESATFDGFTEAVSNYADICNGLYYANFGIGILSSFYGNFGIGSYCFNSAYNWSESYEFFKPDGRGNAQWIKDVLHASHTQRNSYTYWQWNYYQTCRQEWSTMTSNYCRGWGWFGWICSAVSWVVSWISCFWQSFATLVTGYYDTEVLDRSDGTVTEWSARGQYKPDIYGNSFQQSWSSNATIIEAKGVNHSEFRNHPEVTNIFNSRIWNGNKEGNGVDFRDVFYVSPR